MKLYEINEAILNCIDPDTGEVDAEQFDALMMERNDKIENLACWHKDLLAEAAAIRAEEKALAERRQAKERRAASIMGYLEKVLDGQKFETAKAVCSFRKSQMIEISDITKILDDYLKYSQPTADKAAIKAAIKDGLTIEGAELVDTVSMSIK